MCDKKMFGDGKYFLNSVKEECLLYMIHLTTKVIMLTTSFDVFLSIKILIQLNKRFSILP